MIHVYAIAPAGLRVPAGLTGVGGAPVAATRVDDFCVAISRHTAPFDVDEQAVVAHAAVVDALVSPRMPVLPSRLESQYRDEDALASAVRDRSESLQDALGRVAGCVELGVRVADAERPVRTTATDDDPAAYMRARLDDRRRLDELATAIHDPLAALARDSTRRTAAAGRLQMTAAYLVPVDEVATFRSAFEAIAAEHPDLAMVCTGPWPPYSFVDGSRSG